MNFINKIRGYNALAKESEDLRNKLTKTSTINKLYKVQDTLIRNSLYSNLATYMNSSALRAGRCRQAYDSGALYTLIALSQMGRASSNLATPSKLYGVRGANNSPSSTGLNIPVGLVGNEGLSSYILFINPDNSYLIDHEGSLKAELVYLIGILRWAQIVNDVVEIEMLPESFSYFSGFIATQRHLPLLECWESFRDQFDIKGKEYRHLIRSMKRTTGVTPLQLFTAMYSNVYATQSLIV